MNVLLLPLALVLLQAIAPGEAELKYRKPIEEIRKKFQRDIIPIDKNDTKPMKLTLGMSLIDVLYVDEKKVELIVTERYEWVSEDLGWDINESGMEVEHVSVNMTGMWIPDMTILTLIKKTEMLSPDKAIVYHNGTVIYQPTKRMTLYAKSPKDELTDVVITYKSATYENRDLLFETPSKESFDTEFLKHADYAVQSYDVKSQIQTFPPSPGTFDTFSFAIVLRPNILE